MLYNALNICAFQNLAGTELNSIAFFVMFLAKKLLDLVCFSSFYWKSCTAHALRIQNYNWIFSVKN